MNHHPEKLIVFDWNGTILSDTIPSWRSSNICLEFYGAKPISYRRFLETFHFPVIHFYTLNGISVDEILARKDEANHIFQSNYERFSARARTRSGARTVLDWTAQNGLSCIILSNYLTPKITAHLERLKLGHYFHHISAHDCDGTTILMSTTKIDRLSAFMAKRGFRPENTAIIGDSAEEPEIARHLGLTSIGLTGGTISRARLIKAGPDHLIGNLREAIPVLKEKWSL